MAMDIRYRGVERNQLALTMRVAAINLRRLVNLGLACRPPAAWDHLQVSCASGMGPPERQ